MGRFIFTSLVILLMTTCRTVRKAGVTTGQNDDLIAGILHSHPLYFDSLLQNQDEYGIQVIYTQINRSNKNKPTLSDHFFNVSNKYFYPASTVKLPIALLALEKLNGLKIRGLDKNASMITEAGYSGQTTVYNDPTSADGRPTVAQYIKKTFLVSDNDAFNRLYEFLGQEYANKHLHKMGYDDAEIIHRLSIALTEDENRHTNPVKFFDTALHVLYEQPLANSKLVFADRHDRKGKGYYSGDKLINEPFDFSKKNRLSLADLHSILKSVFFPKQLTRKKRFKIKKDDARFVAKYMSMFPRESDYPSYDSSLQDAYSRFILWGEGKEKQSGNIRIFHKSGAAYGFLTDVCYVVDFENKIEFMLSATIHCNRDSIYNDDRYDYDSIGIPFLKNLGQVFYDYERTRSRKNKPDLTPLQFVYNH